MKNNAVKIFKFGGASIATPKLMKNVAEIIAKFGDERLVVVVSAMGKTTNALEEIARGYFEDKEGAKGVAATIKADHVRVCEQLLTLPQPTIDKVNNLFVEIDWLLEDDVETDEGYVYDQVVSIGELASTTILADYLKQAGLAATWVDARGVIFTTDVYQQAEVLWDKTCTAAQMQFEPILRKGIVITQGFIGSTTDNNTTTLGREGSDFSGAIFANCLDAESLTIWKDVPGVLNADPRWLADTVKLTEMNYREAVEQTYYGAKVIHPKTIKPLQNKGIPLHVRSFKDVSEVGTTINPEAQNLFEKPVFVLKKNQVLLHCYTSDFSFFDNDDINAVMKVFGDAHCNINLLQNGAVQCSFVFDDDEEMIEGIYRELQTNYIVKVDRGLELLTIRHYTDDAVREMTSRLNILMEQRTPINYQALIQP